MNNLPHSLMQQLLKRKNLNDRATLKVRLLARVFRSDILAGNGTSGAPETKSEPRTSTVLGVPSSSSSFPVHILIRPEERINDCPWSSDLFFTAMDIRRLSVSIQRRPVASGSHFQTEVTRNWVVFTCNYAFV